MFSHETWNISLCQTVIGKRFLPMGHFQLFSMILKFSMGPFLSFYTDFYGPFSKLMGLWRMAPCLLNHWSDIFYPVNSVVCSLKSYFDDFGEPTLSPKTLNLVCGLRRRTYDFEYNYCCTVFQIEIDLHRTAGRNVVKIIDHFGRNS